MPPGNFFSKRYKGGLQAALPALLKTMNKQERAKFLMKFARLFAETHERHPNGHYGIFLKKVKRRTKDEGSLEDSAWPGDKPIPKFVDATLKRDRVWWEKSE